MKQLEVPVAGGHPLIVSPRLTIEPVPTYYQRLASGYRFVRHKLEAAFGQAVLHDALASLSGASLFDVLSQAELLFRGAALTCRQELGQALPMDGESEAALSFFRAWQRGSAKDPDLNADMRVAVPVFIDAERNTVHICATVGLEARRLKVEFMNTPTVRVFRPSLSPAEEPSPLFMPSAYMVVVPVTIECDVKIVPTREELRRVCDEFKTPERICEALRGRC